MSQNKQFLKQHLKKELTHLTLSRGFAAAVCSCNFRLKWQNSILTDGEIAAGFVLTCQAHPTSESVYVDYDDV
jgi:hypothetical protein